jgi:hypothetical protein
MNQTRKELVEYGKKHGLEAVRTLLGYHLAMGGISKATYDYVIKQVESCT